ncbi:hypothetical protein [Fontibacillus phaseoli]|uniref:hypothetical protein n=1 Tax=Fontibacillus phaseoli TaxID=1416533 RepID=UPI000DF23564|nr:hypothetical protein [Fontibacillus phaseoli]
MNRTKQEREKTVITATFVLAALLSGIPQREGSRLPSGSHGSPTKGRRISVSSATDQPPRHSL